MRLKVLVGIVTTISFAYSFTTVCADAPNKTSSQLPPGVTKRIPGSIEDLKAIQNQTKKVIANVIPCTVGVQIGGASGSGVIVSKDGLILTAGHVSGKPDQKCTIILSDGRRIEGKSLGRDKDIDSGMFKITTEGEWPYTEMGDSSSVHPGQWCIAIGHPNGYMRGRTPVVRLGKILRTGKNDITTDCTLVGGDSGGPLFDMEGKVIAIHSRIGPTISTNIHVPIDVFRTQWSKLVKGDDIGPPKALLVYLGVKSDEGSKNCKLARVTEGSPAEKAGLKAGDIVTRFDGKDIKSYDDMLSLLSVKKPGDEVEIVVKRGQETMKLKAKLDKRG